MHHFADTLRSLRRALQIRSLFPVFLLVLLSHSLAPAGLAQGDFSVDDLPDIQRMHVLADACTDLELNTLCFGGGTVNVTANGTTTTLSEMGARLPLAGVQRIETLADDANCTWGGVVLSLQGTVGAVQGNMTYVALGNVVLENATAPEALFTPAAALQVAVNTDNLNFRAAPSMTAEVIGQFDTGNLINADALSADGAWLRVEAEGVTGWVAREFTDSADDLSTLPTLSESSKGWMQDFRLHTAPSACPATLPSLLVVQTAGNQRVPMNVNGIDISIGSTIAFNTLSDFALGGPDTVDPSDAELGGPDTVDPTENQLGGPDTFGSTQMVVIDGSLMLPGLEAGDETYAFADEAGEIVGYGLGLGMDEDDNAESFLLEEGTGILIDPTASDAMTAQLIFNVEDSAESTTDTVLPLPEGLVFAEDLGVVQLVGGMLPDDKPNLHFDLPEYYDNWLDAEIHEPSGAFCDDFEVISPKSGFILLPPDSDLTFNYPSVAMSNWSMYLEAGESLRLGMITTFHLGRPNGNDLKAPVSQEYVFPYEDYKLVDDLLEPKSITYNYYQLQGMGLIIPNATSGQLLWWVENTMYYIWFDDTGWPIGVASTCITALNLINWAHTETAELADDIIDPVLAPNDDSIGDTIPDIDVNVQPTPTFNPLATPNTFPIEPMTPTPPPRDSDGDGVLDDADRCPAERGVPENAGCPLPPTAPPARDADGDGVPDDQDRCPTERGVPENSGCPFRRAGG